ncbi:cytochrome c maturation protein CcmE [Desulfocurvus sp.]|uniref:cytochrome c maturation protein CcmE n=1 Tax=Desulfocurvus sp. TaxID=2871698 RepID=UPI0025C2DC34|nr:cytochrome c maturation protein CcmE [Desulfocurvus sp.]MCK9239564.1 cytochrome c maturation protein CcmE [Desulfocurvus sp.]
MAKKSNTSIYAAALALLLGGLGWLIFSGVSENSVYFVNVAEALALPEGELKNARLFGVVDDKDLSGGPGTMGATFRLLDKDDTSRAIVVSYSGAVPDTFKPGVEVIVEGGVAPGAHAFTARTLMTKCPSKYQKMRDEEKAGKADQS